MWLFIARHPSTNESDRQRVLQLVENTAQDLADRAWAEERAQCYELTSLADALAQSGDNRADRAHSAADLAARDV